MKRDSYLNDLISFKDKNLIKVITGIRNCGKSTLFELYKDYLLQRGVKQECIISVNLEKADFIKNSEQLYTYVKKQMLENQKHYILLDEVQHVENFQEAIVWLYTDKMIDLYIIGSNACLLSGKSATLLSGRYVEIKMMPLSFKEYCSNFPKQSNTSHLYLDYITNSSFPRTLELPHEADIRLYLEGIYYTVLMEDILARKEINESSLLKSIVEFIFDNIGNVISSNEIANILASNGRKINASTIEAYLSALCDSYIVYKVYQYDVKRKQYLANSVKYYICDIGLRYYLSGIRLLDMEHVLENVVYLELLRRRYKVYIGKIGDIEVDFIAINIKGVEYYQVTQTVLDPKTLKQELSSLEAIKDHNPKYLLTMDYTPLTSYNGIRQINVLEWLLK